MPTEQTCGKGRVLRNRQGDGKAKLRLHRSVPFSEQLCAPQHMPQSSYATRSCCHRCFMDISAKTSLNTPRQTPPGKYVWPNASEISHLFSTADFKFHFSNCFRTDCTRHAPPAIQRCKAAANGQCFGSEAPPQAVETAASSGCRSSASLLKASAFGCGRTHRLFIYI